MLILSLSACMFLSADESATGPEAVPAADVIPKPPTGTPLAALVATSGDALPLMDGNPVTMWHPEGHRANEGVLFRFEQPTRISGIRLRSCGRGEGTLQAFLDGAEHGAPATLGREDTVIDTEDREVRSVFLRVDQWSKMACLGEVSFDGAEIRGPRTVSATVSSSSTLDPAPAYRASYLFDSRLDFGWVEGSKGLGLGDWVQAKLGAPVEVHAVEIWNGYQRSPDHFKKNARAKRVRVMLDGKSFELDVPDVMGSSKLELPEPVTTKSVKIEILEAHKGTRYEDLVLTEARLWDGEGPLAVVEPDPYMGQILEGARDSQVGGMLDRLLVSHCEPTERQLKLRSNSSFVWYDRAGEQSEVFDGAWVLQGSEGQASMVQLYGRRHRTTVDWSPYGSGDVEETVRIAGGKPLFTRVNSLDRAAFEQKIRKVSEAEGRDCDYDYEDLKSKDAVIVEGRAITDVLVKDPSRG